METKARRRQGGARGSAPPGLCTPGLCAPRPPWPREQLLGAVVLRRGAVQPIGTGTGFRAGPSRRIPRCHPQLRGPRASLAALGAAATGAAQARAGGGAGPQS